MGVVRVDFGTGWVWILGLLLSSCVISGKSLNSPEPFCLPVAQELRMPLSSTWCEGGGDLGYVLSIMPGTWGVLNKW